MKRRDQIVLLGSFVPLCWLGAMVVHELGHMLAAWATGGTVTNVVLHPLAFSRTDVSPDPHPLIVVWAGPMVGSLLPVAAWGIATWAKCPGVYLLRFFAGSCLLISGAYVGIGSFDEVGDTFEMMLYGSPQWSLWLFGAITMPAGIALWNGLGPSFGLGHARGKVSRAAAYVSLTLLVAVVTIELVLTGLTVG